MVTEGKEAKAQFNFLYNTSASIAAGLSNDSWPVIEAVVWTFVSLSNSEMIPVHYF